MFYYLSIGTNIEPEKNAVKIVELLCRQFGPLTLYPFSYTQPESIDTQARFLNALAIVSCKLAPEKVKDYLNCIEIKLGRDRNDPERSVKDRTADIDIITHSKSLDTQAFEDGDEKYITDIYSGKLKAVDLSSEGLPFDRTPMIVRFNTTVARLEKIDMPSYMDFWDDSAAGIVSNAG